jgi:DNA-binding transcriptional LysR family regulator
MQNDPHRLPPLDLLLAFEAAARHLSFTRAGEERFVTQSAMSRQIRALEDELGIPLFVRQHRALELTPAGQRLLATCSAVLEQLREAVAEVRAPAARETLALTTTPSFAALWLIPRLAHFTAAHPGIDVRLDASYEVRDLRREGFALTVRYGPIGDTAGEQLFGESIVAVCSPALLRDAERPLKHPRDLARHTLIQLVFTIGGSMPLEWESWLRAVNLPGVQPASVLSLNNYNEVVAAALAGQGVALGRRPLIDDLLRQGKLVMPFQRRVKISSRGYFVIAEPRAEQRPAVRAFADWLVAQARGAAGS